MQSTRPIGNCHQPEPAALFAILLISTIWRRRGLLQPDIVTQGRWLRMTVLKTGKKTAVSRLLLWILPMMIKKTETKTRNVELDQQYQRPEW